MPRNERDPSLEGHILDTLRWLAWFIVLLGGIATLAFAFARPVGPDDKASQSSPPNTSEARIPLGDPSPAR